MLRKIIHIDMDAFFAAVEERDHPELHNVPMAVGHSDKRGVIATANYAARKFGVHSALSSVKAKAICPQLIILPGRMELYKEISNEIRQIFLDYTDIIEPISIDEAFLDVTENKKNIEWAVDIAIEIKKRIREELHLVASAGISYNKFLAKIASDYRKPDGLCTIHPNVALDFIAKLPIESFWGIGPVTAKRLHLLGIHNGKQLRECTREMLIRQFGKAGSIYYDFSRGIDERPVIPYRIRKSIGCEKTLEQDINLKSSAIIELYHVTTELVERLHRADFQGSTLTLKIKFADFSQITRSITINKNGKLNTIKDILPKAKKLLSDVDYEQRYIRLIGLSVSNRIENEEESSDIYNQLNLDFEY
jgi:DNA polymerase-4